MKNIYSILKKSPLFIGISEGDIESLLNCLDAQERRIKKGSIIFSVGERPEYVGLVLEGSIHVVQEDYWGNRSILTAVQTGGLFAEAFSAAEVSVLPISVLAHSDCKILLIDCRHILTTCSNSCMFHSRLIRNLIKIVSSSALSNTLSKMREEGIIDFEKNRFTLLT